MNRSEICAFLKAPFKGRFLLACALCLPVLLATPLIFSFFEFVYSHITTFQNITTDKEEAEVLYDWFVGLDTFSSITAAFGLFFATLLFSGYICMLAHTIIKEKAGAFDFRPVSLTGAQILTGIMKAISYFFWGAAYGILCFSAMIALLVLVIFVGKYLPRPLNTLLWIATIVTELACLFWMILNTWASNFRFLTHLKTRAFFQWRENYLYLKKYKGRFFIALALCLVFSWIVQILLQTFYTWIITIGSYLEGVLLGFQVPQPNVVIVFGLLAAIAITVYLCLLQAMFKAKAIVWLEGKQEKSTPKKKQNKPKKTASKKKK